MANSWIRNSYFFKIRDDGGTLWENTTIGKLNWGFVPTDLCDGGLLLAGWTLSRIDPGDEVVWWVNETWDVEWGPPKPDALWWLYPHAVTSGEDGTFVVVGMTDGPTRGGDFFVDNKAGVMHIAKFRDPDLATICPKPPPISLTYQQLTNSQISR